MRNPLFGLAALLALLAPPLQAAELPIFDAHVHYSHDAWENLPPKDAVALLRKAGLKRALVSSSGDAGTQRLVAEAPDLIVPSLRPYRSRGEISSWVRDDSVVGFLEERLRNARYAAVGEFHLYGADAELPVPRRMVALAKQHKLVLHAHSDADAIERLFQQDPQARVLWAHSGFDRPEKVAEAAAQAQEPVVRPGLPQRAWRRRQGAGRMARAVHRIPRPLHGRHRHLHARALALRRRARQLDARLAGRPAAAAGRTHCLAQCGGAVLVLEGGQLAMSRAGGAALLALWAAGPALACGDSLGSGTRRIEDAQFLLIYKPRPSRCRWAGISASTSRCARAARRHCPTKCASMRRCPSTSTA